MDGTDLEKSFYRGLKKAYENKPNMSITSYVGTAFDIKEGFDFIINKFGREYRIDPTFDYNYKTQHGKTETIGKTSIIEGNCLIEVTFGYKTHNGHSDLPNPVLVIGITDRNSTLEDDNPITKVDFEENIYKAVDFGIDRFNEKEFLPKIKENSFILENIPAKIQTPLMQETAIKYTPKELIPDLAWIINDPPNYIEKELVNKNGLAIQAISKPSPELQTLAVKENPEALFEIDNPTQEALKYVMANNPRIYNEYITLQKDSLLVDEDFYQNQNSCHVSDVTEEIEEKFIAKENPSTNKNSIMQEVEEKRAKGQKMAEAKKELLKPVKEQIKNHPSKDKDYKDVDGIPSKNDKSYKPGDTPLSGGDDHDELG